jgi:hypothetical protein
MANPSPVVAAVPLVRDDSDSDDESEFVMVRPVFSDPKADDLVKAANRKLTPSIIHSIQGNRRFEEAIEMLEKAAASYKLNKNWSVKSAKRAEDKTTDHTASADCFFLFTFSCPCSSGWRLAMLTCSALR